MENKDKKENKNKNKKEIQKKKTSIRTRLAALIISLGLTLSGGVAIGRLTGNNKDDLKKVDELTETVDDLTAKLDLNIIAKNDAESRLKNLQGINAAEEETLKNKKIYFNKICSLNNSLNPNLSNYANTCKENYDITMYKDYLNKYIKYFQLLNSNFLTQEESENTAELYEDITNNSKALESLKELLIRSKLQEAFVNKSSDTAIVYTYKPADKSLIIGYPGSDIDTYNTISSNNIPSEILELLTTQTTSDLDSIEKNLFLLSNLANTKYIAMQDSKGIYSIINGGTIDKEDKTNSEER